MFTLPRFKRALEATLTGLPAAAGPTRLCVALSGGLDSSVLLVALAEVARDHPERWTLRAIHVDHALHADSARWSRASRDLADARHVPFETARVDARGAAGQSPEAAAREARYAAFRQRLAPGEVLVTAHHADDQLETVLLQWLRGGGLRAVAGMPPLVPMGPCAWHARPLLEFVRVELEAWAREQGLAWIEDPSNEDRRFDRNYLRHEVLPAVLRRWPAAARTTGRVADFARDALALEASVATQDLEQIRRGRAIELPRLMRLPEPRQRAALRAWLAILGFPAPAAETLAAMRRDMRIAAPDRIPETRWPGVVVRRYRDRLYADGGDVPAVLEGTWGRPDSAPYAWSESSTIELQPDVGVGLSRTRLPGRLVVRRRRGGEEFQPAGRAHRRPLRKWLQEHDVLPWRREDLPLLCEEDGRLVAVADLACAGPYAAKPGEPSWRIVWRGRSDVTEPDAFGFKWPGHPPIG